MTAAHEVFGAIATAAVPKSDTYAERILQAAKELFTEHGLRRTSIADIAKAAGVSERTVYNRFNDRQGLLNALLILEGTAYKAAVDARLATTEVPSERLVLSFVTMAQHVRNDQLLRRLVITDPETVLPILTTGAGPLIVYMRDWVNTYSEGADLVADANAISEILARLTHSMLLTPETSLPMQDDESAAEFARSVLAPMLFGRNG